MANSSILSAFERMWQHTVNALSNKSDITHTHTAAEVGADQVGSAAAALSLAETYTDEKISSHTHDDKYEPLGSVEDALNTSKEYTDNKVASMIFIGTYAEYQTAYADGQIPINTFVILTDDESGSGSSGGGSTGGDSTSTSTSSLLGTGALGYMILG